MKDHWGELGPKPWKMTRAAVKGKWNLDQTKRNAGSFPQRECNDVRKTAVLSNCEWENAFEQ